LILDYDKTQKFSRIYRYDFAERLPDDLSTKIILRLIEEEQQRDFSLVGYDLAFVAEHDDAGQRVQDRLYVVAADGNQTFAFRLCLRDKKIELQPIAEYLPMRLFGGKGLVAAGTSAYYDFADGWIPLVQQRRPRYVTAATLETPLDAPLEKPFFDGREPDCVWHRLLLDACIPAETRVEVWSRTANEARDLSSAQWQLEPRLYLRGDGSELPFLRSRPALKGQSPAGATDGAGTWELLFQRARGRFLQLRIRLSGNERSTPRLRSLRAYYPRFSYLVNYLPGVYREDEQSASFLDRYLGNLEGFYTTLEDKIAMAQVLFDVRSAPVEVLDWLASWFGIALDPTWDETRRRLFVKHAMDFFQYRGTRRGLTMALHLALDPCADETIFDDASLQRRNQEIRIVEKYLMRRTAGVVFGDPSEQTGLRNVTVASFWQPAQGRANLSQRYASFIDPQNKSATVIQYPLIAPLEADQAALWSQFSQTTFGFIPATAASDHGAWQAFLQARYGNIGSLNVAHATSHAAFVDIFLPRDLPKRATALRDWQDFVLDPKPARTPVARRLWQDFLARRYRRIKALNQTYGTNWTSFEIVSLPDELPADEAPLRDWFQFESVAMQMQRTAHRFTVLLPVPLSLAFSPEEHQRRLALSRRIIDLEKPAHTVFDVKFYWAMFRLGEARLQLDTVIDQGSRAPQLLPQLVLGQGFVGESYLAAPAAESASDRYILGRDPLGRTPDRERRS
ncbi:MAG TPA: phage tail protein, partial [Pyrinomonadaceae bacterium]|nr:phage tail protein [Pyrinomonadaceae bacterium]